MQVLVKMRPEGHDIQEELMDIQRNAKETSEESFWASVTTLYSRGHYKQAMAALFIPFFQQFTGMNAIMFYGARPLVFFSSLAACHVCFSLTLCMQALVGPLELDLLGAETCMSLAGLERPCAWFFC